MKTMLRTRRNGVVFTAMGVVCLLLMFALRPLREPTHEGGRLSEWLSDYDESRWQLREFGPEARIAVPSLVDMLLKHELGWNVQAVATTLASISTNAVDLIRPHLQDPSFERKTRAAAALGAMGARATNSVPELLALARVPEKDLRAAVASALYRIDATAARQTGIEDPHMKCGPGWILRLRVVAELSLTPAPLRTLRSTRRLGDAT